MVFSFLLKLLPCTLANRHQELMSLQILLWMVNNILLVISKVFGIVLRSAALLDASYWTAVNKSSVFPQHFEGRFGYSWGNGQSSLLKLYNVLCKSRLNYASQIYSSAWKTNLEILDVVHNSALRICTGAYRTSPIESLYLTAGETFIFNPLEFWGCGGALHSAATAPISFF